MSDPVLVELYKGVLTITLNEPDTMNALSKPLNQGLIDALQRASDDKEVRVVLLTGAGSGFCAGTAVDALN